MVKVITMRLISKCATGRVGGIMDTGKADGINREKISRRTYLVASLAIFGTAYATGNALAVELPSERKVVPIGDDYVLVDGWVLRADDLVQ